MSETTSIIGGYQNFEKKNNGLLRIESLLCKLSNPQKDLKVIHVAGTNGKGSVSRYIYEILRASGYKVGIYTSPYLQVFNERIEYDGEYISDNDLKRLTDLVTSVADDKVTKFDIITAIMFKYFEEKKPNFVILEVGLGGRLDSTNIVEKPLVSIITSIAMDHMERLGNTIEEIAEEKAGIIKENVPVVSGVINGKAKNVILQKANLMNSCFIDAADINYNIEKADVKGSVFNINNFLSESFNGISISMIGEYQVRNSITAIAAIELLRKQCIIKVEQEDLYKGLARAKNMGRFEVLKTDPYYIVDGAHNAEGIEAFCDTIKTNFKNKKLLIVAGFLEDKDVRRMLQILCSLKADFIASEANSCRKMDCKILNSKMRDIGLNTLFSGSVSDVVKKISDFDSDYDVICFVGSLYMIGEVRGYYCGKDKR